MLNFLYRIKCLIKRRKTVKKVNRALGIQLTKWQIDFIFENRPYSAEIATKRCNGKTLAHILRICLKNDLPLYEPIIMKRTRADTKLMLMRYVGEDSATERRMHNFMYELRYIYEKLSAAGDIELRDIRF